MSDTICAACHTPKPPCCYCYTGSDGTVCQPCHRDLTHNANVRRARSRTVGERRRRMDKMLATHPERYAEGLASLIERTEAR